MMKEVEELRDRLTTRRIALQSELQDIDATLRNLDKLRGYTATEDAEWRAVGIVDGTRKLYLEDPTPRSTREIATELKKKGIKTEAKHFQATVYATLRESPWFKMDKDHRWVMSLERK